MSYVPPHMRNKQSTSDSTPKNMERSSAFHKERRQPRRPYEKPQWQIEKENADAEQETKLDKQRRGMENTEENFPSLGFPFEKTVTWSGERKFTELASEWKESNDKQKEEEQVERTRSENNEYTNTFILPRFRNIHRFEEPEDQDILIEKEIDNANKNIDDNDGWTVVERKNRKSKREKTLEELDAEYQKSQEEDDIKDETVWGAPEEHETCWDERRY